AFTAYPLSVRSLSTSRSMLRRPIATIRPSPTTTSDAATAITEIANTWPSSCPCSRENAISSRLDAFSLISIDSRMISGLRRSSTPSAPVVKSSALRITYHWMSGPCIGSVLQRERIDPARVRAEHDAADRGDEQHDRGHLECEQVVG